ncbi:hypothetical protein [Confluentibacter sediminis]|uniref:hypothetical protein n=1 Tax=Confluentibacter sediminis TaxID=2219045 RepID=UPI000DACF916|nr:hypothetical protein [Confluentibacter sediminis]
MWNCLYPVRKRKYDETVKENKVDNKNEQLLKQNNFATSIDGKHVKFYWIKNNDVEVASDSNAFGHYK